MWLRRRFDNSAADDPHQHSGAPHRFAGPDGQCHLRSTRHAGSFHCSFHLQSAGSATGADSECHQRSAHRFAGCSHQQCHSDGADPAICHSLHTCLMACRRVTDGRQQCPVSQGGCSLAERCQVKVLHGWDKPCLVSICRLGPHLSFPSAVNFPQIRVQLACFTRLTMRLTPTMPRIAWTFPWQSISSEHHPRISVPGCRDI